MAHYGRITREGRLDATLAFVDDAGEGPQQAWDSGEARGVSGQGTTADDALGLPCIPLCCAVALLCFASPRGVHFPQRAGWIRCNTAAPMVNGRTVQCAFPL